MSDAISRVMKINIRARSKDRINTLLRDILGGAEYSQSEEFEEPVEDTGDRMRSRTPGQSWLT